MSKLHPMDLMNAVPEDGDIPREIVALMKGCTCRGDSHDPQTNWCSMGEPVAVDVEAYRGMVAAAFEMSKVLNLIAEDANSGGDAVGRAEDVLRRLGLRD